MARYIDADALIERLKFKRDVTDIGRKKHSGLECAIAQVQKQPTADVASEVITDLQQMWKVCSLQDRIYGISVYVISKRDYNSIIDGLKKKYTEGE